MTPREAYEWLASHGKETAYLESMGSLLRWDQRTYIPPGGHPHRAAQLANLARLLHIRHTDPRIGEMLAVVEGSELTRDPLGVEAVNIREWRRTFDRTTKLPERLAVDLARAGSEGQSVWEEARPKNDWNAFKPHLERLISLKREEAEALGYEHEPYDALLDDFEPGETARNIEPVFSELRKALVDLLNRIEGSSRRSDTSILRRHYPRAAQETFARAVLERVGYDFGSGRMDPTSHPFTISIGPGDVRITTRYDVHQFTMGFFGAVHEAGHALYNHGLPAEHWGTPMGRSVSLGIHESQSRMWENLVGRSLGFWKHVYPEAQRLFPALEDVPLESFYFAVNDVRPSLIRTEADEVTYNLHVLLRFELELALMRRELNADDLPEAWSQKMKDLLGLEPPDYADGVMQDIHWAGGAIGYFPTYTLGNLFAAQFFTRAEQDLGDLQQHFSAGELSPLLQWLRAKIHSQGKRYRSRDLVKTVTGEDLNPRRLIDYLREKFGALYGF